MLFVITGNGKGKTTSAIGAAIRGIGWGKKTALVFFDKGGSHYGEQHIFDLLQEKITVHRSGQQRFDEKARTFRFTATDKDKEEARKGIQKVIDLYKEDYFLVICDELINCLDLGMTDKASVEKLIRECPAGSHLMLTGRNAPAWLTKKADLVSEIKDVKHHYRKTGKTVKGIDY